ncbi:MAG: WYL domain-containing protein [Terrimesophilobacter sp.]
MSETGKGPAQRIPVEERLFSLVLALLATDQGLTKHQILSTVQGYAQRYVAGGDNANLERQFERDKDDIRELGVPLETIESPGQAGNNQNLKYRIPRGLYELPEDIRFTAEESTLLSLAGMVWREGSMSGESRRAIIKLKSMDVKMIEPVLAYAPRIRVRDTSFEPLSAAIDKQQLVRFDYLKPGETDARARTVAPLALIQFQGRWHLTAVERGSGERRTFLLRRIVGQVTATGKSDHEPTSGEADRGLHELQEVWESHTATVIVEPASDAETRLSKRRGTGLGEGGQLELHFVDLNIFADELAGYGPEVLVTAPPELVMAVRERLIMVASAHFSAAPPSPLEEVPGV